MCQMAQIKIQEYVPDGSNQNSGICARWLKPKFRNMCLMAQTKVQEYVPDGSNQNSGIQYVPEVSNQNSGVLE